jgi:predicted dehydrogenase
MSELGSHQIDVANWLWDSAPDTVCGAGGIFKYKDGREVEDHVFATFRYPNDRVFTFSSITTNAFDHYYDQIMGTKGTIYLTGESEAMFFKEGTAKTTQLNIDPTKSGEAAGSASGSRSRDMMGQIMTGGGGDSIDAFLAYGHELKLFAHAVRNGDPSLVGCDGVAGMRAAVAVLKSNEAIAKNTVESCKLEGVVA